ncbi:C2 domain-containing protein [Zalerion maritima]|uniref:C2 domain-containing protein n=1 Tax=Zalerion maritima TaxID=339359 RepID=A0AAD5WQE4_9PEZI|nr:C2 domain-containing protein [Zalerion maritima]
MSTAADEAGEHVPQGDVNKPSRSQTLPLTNGAGDDQLPRAPSHSQTTPLENGHAAPGQKIKPRATFASSAKRRFAQQKKTLKEKTNPSGGYDPTPLPDAPPGYTIKFSFIRATNLPVADVHTGRSDPFVKATLGTIPQDILKRHKEDPDLVHRTRPARRTLDPEWHDEWVVANVPASGFKLKCRVYDEDYPAQDDRLGNVTVEARSISEAWNDYVEPQSFKVKKRSGNKSVYFFKTIWALLSRTAITPTLWLAIEVLGKSDPPHGKMYTVGPTGWIKHYSPMIGRMIGTKVNKDEGDDVRQKNPSKTERQTKKYDFQANEMQLSGPVPSELYHRYVEFRPLIGLMFSRTGLRGRILNGMLHKQHRRVYNFDSSTEYGEFEPQSEQASAQFLRMAHFDEGGRIFTYILTLDGMFRFTETGKEFGIDMLSKHSMHSDVATYIACSGEFFIGREGGIDKGKGKGKEHKKGHGRETVSRDEDEPRISVPSWKSWRKRSDTASTHKSQQSNKGESSKPQEDPKEEKEESGKYLEEPKDDNRPSSSGSGCSAKSPREGRPSFFSNIRRGRLFSHSSGRPPTAQSKVSEPLPNNKKYRLFIDNDSGTYRPDKSLLPILKGFLEEQFPGLNITVHDCGDEELKAMKKEQSEIKKSKGVRINMVLNRSPSASSFSSSDESRLDEMEARALHDAEDGTVVATTKDAIKALRKGKNRAVESMVV